MSEKKKLTTAEILAAARKSDSTAAESTSQGGSAPRAKPGAEQARPEAESGGKAKQQESGVAVDKPSPAAGVQTGKKPTAGMSVAEILAMARAEKTAGTAGKEDSKSAAAAKPVAAKAAPRSAAVVEAPAKKERSEVPAGGKAAGRPIRDTASILAAARQGPKSGPVSKAEAAKFSSPAPPKPAKEKAVLPPMPAKPAYARREAAATTTKTSEPIRRRSMLARVLVGSFLAAGFASLAATMALWTLAFARFMFPNILREPPSRFKVGFPSDYPPGHVEEKYKAQFGVWVVHGDYAGEPQIYALKTVCTHLGCTPNWLDAENKFKCPCHGSGFYKDGINFEGPAPRPLERYAIRLSDDGQLEIDKSRIFQEEMGQWSDPLSFVPA